MGLFNRNKGDDAAPSTPGAGTQPSADNTFDFDAISRDLDAQNGASSFDSLLAAPVNNSQQTPTKEASTLDFPENDPLGLSTPAASTPTPTVTAPVAASPEAVINAPISPSPSPIIGTAPANPAPIAPPAAPTEVPAPKKSLPLVPLLGALGLLAVAGGGAMLLLNSGREADVPIPVAPPAQVGQAPGQPAGAPGAPAAPGTTAAPPAPVAPPGAGAPIAPSAQGSTGGPAAPANLRSASPGIAPPPAPKRPIEGAKGSSNVSILTGQSPANRAPSATSGLDSALASKLKALWQAGANAKHKGNYKAARDAWGEALRLRPGHPGFQDSINKLPR